MWLLYRAILVTTLFIGAFEASAQQPVDTTSTPQQAAPAQPGVLPAPSDQSLNPNQQFMTAPAVQPAPIIEPMISPQDRAARDARILAEQQQQAQQQQAAQQQSGIIPQQPADATTFAAPQQQQQGAAQQNYQDNSAYINNVPPATEPGMLQPTPATSTPTATDTATTPAVTTGVAPTSNPQATPAAASLTQGFAPAAAAGNGIPTNTGGGMMPVPNAGLDMNLNPQMVGGMEGNVNTDPTQAMPGIPYEIQLQQRTMELQKQARNQAFEQAKQSILPMETYEIRDVMGRLKDTQEAIQTPIRPTPKPGNVIKTVSTDPSSKPHVIHLATGNVTTLNIVDITGEPWPIVDVGFGGFFDVKPPEPGGHVVRITPQKDFAQGNMVVRLLKLTTPITFTLKAGGDKVNYRFDARIPEYGPNAKMPLINEGGIGAVAGDKVTTAFLEGIPPKGAERILTDGVDGRTAAYRYAGTLYVRTPLSLLSPAWQGSATSSDGMNVYVLEEAPVLLLSDKGTLVRAHLGDTAKAFKE